jgi:hypothetical protein
MIIAATSLPLSAAWKRWISLRQSFSSGDALRAFPAGLKSSQLFF